MRKKLWILGPIALLAILPYAYGRYRVLKHTGHFCLIPKEVSNGPYLGDTVTLFWCDSGLYTESPGDEHSEPFTYIGQFEGYIPICRTNYPTPSDKELCNRLKRFLLDDHRSLSAKQQKYLREVGVQFGFIENEGATHEESPSPTSTIDSSEGPLTLSLDLQNAHVNGVSLNVPVDELKTAFGSQRVRTVVENSEMDGPETTVEIDFGSDRVLTIYPERRLASVTHAAFVTKEGLHVGSTFAEFAHIYQCDASTWEAGEIQRTSCRQEISVGTSERPRPESLVEAIFFSVKN